MMQEEGILQERLEQIEAGQPLEEVIADLPPELAEMVTLAAELRALEAPPRAEDVVQAQRGEVLDAARQVEGWQQPGRSLTPYLAVMGAAALLIMLCSGAALMAWGFGLFNAEEPLAADEAAPVTATVTEGPATPSEGILLADAAGLVEVWRAGAWQPIAPGSVVSAGERIRTGPLSEAALTLPDGSQARLSEQTELALNQLGAQLVILGQRGGGVTYTLTDEAAAGTVEVTAEESGVVVEAGAVDLRTPQGETVIIPAGYRLPAGSSEPFLSISGMGVVTQTGAIWRIAGQTFLTGEGTTITGDPQPGDLVRIEGRSLVDNTRFADRITLVQPGQPFTLSGPLEDVSGDMLRVAGQPVRLPDDALITAGLQPGDSVQVVGTVQGGIPLAHSVSAAGDQFTLSGVVQATGETWQVSGISLVVSAPPTGVAVGDVVTVSGFVDADGLWQAESFDDSASAGAFAFAGPLTSMDPWTVAGVVLTTGPDTIISPELDVGDEAFVAGRILSDGSFLADTIQRVGDDDDEETFAFQGTLNSMDPWVIGGIEVAVDEGTALDDDLTVGEEARVEGLILEDGTLQALHITAVDDDPDDEFGCLSISAIVVSVTAQNITLTSAQTISLDDDVLISGSLTTASVVILQTCAGDDGVINLVAVIVVYQLDDLPDIGDTGSEDSGGGDDGGSGGDDDDDDDDDD